MIKYKLLISTIKFLFATCHPSMQSKGIKGAPLNGVFIEACSLGLQVLFGFILWKSKLHNVDSLC
jgi:hypothetical protein